MHTPKASLLIKYFVLGVLLMLGLLKIAEANWHGFFMIVLAFFFSLIPTFLKKAYGIHTPYLLQAGVALFMFSTIFLGEVENFYVRFWWWDSVFHALAGVGLGLIAYIILVLTYEEHNIRTAALFTAVFAISFSVALSVLWELIEFVIDLIAGSNMQPSLNDTMWDLIAGLGGALIGAFAGQQYLKRRKMLGMHQIITEGVHANRKHRN